MPLQDYYYYLQSQVRILHKKWIVYMNRVAIISLCALFVAMNIFSAEKNKILITNNCSESIEIHAHLFAMQQKGAFFFAKVESVSTLECEDAFAINTLKVGNITQFVYVPVLWGDRISLVEES